jgi:hypothetical protein
LREDIYKTYLTKKIEQGNDNLPLVTLTPTVIDNTAFLQSEEFLRNKSALAIKMSDKKGVKPEISLNVTYKAGGLISENFTLTIKNLSIPKWQVNSFHNMYIRAGYIHGTRRDMYAKIFSVYQDSPNPNGTTIITGWGAGKYLDTTRVSSIRVDWRGLDVVSLEDYIYTIGTVLGTPIIMHLPLEELKHAVVVVNDAQEWYNSVQHLVNTMVETLRYTLRAYGKQADEGGISTLSATFCNEGLVLYMGKQAPSALERITKGILPEIRYVKTVAIAGGTIIIETLWLPEIRPGFMFYFDKKFYSGDIASAIEQDIFDKDNIYFCFELAVQFSTRGENVMTITAISGSSSLTYNENNKAIIEEEEKLVSEAEIKQKEAEAALADADAKAKEALKEAEEALNKAKAEIEEKYINFAANQEFNIKITMTKTADTVGLGQEVKIVPDPVIPVVEPPPTPTSATVPPMAETTKVVESKEEKPVNPITASSTEKVSEKPEPKVTTTTVIVGTAATAIHSTVESKKEYATLWEDFYWTFGDIVRKNIKDITKITDIDVFDFRDDKLCKKYSMLLFTVDKEISSKTLSSILGMSGWTVPEGITLHGSKKLGIFDIVSSIVPKDDRAEGYVLNSGSGKGHFVGGAQNGPLLWTFIPIFATLASDYDARYNNANNGGKKYITSEANYSSTADFSGVPYFGHDYFDMLGNILLWPEPRKFLNDNKDVITPLLEQFVEYIEDHRDPSISKFKEGIEGAWSYTAPQSYRELLTAISRGAKYEDFFKK